MIRKEIAPGSSDEPEISTLAYRRLCAEVTKELGCPLALADNEKDSIGSAPAEGWGVATEWRAGALRIEFIERSWDESLGIK